MPPTKRFPSTTLPPARQRSRKSPTGSPRACRWSPGLSERPRLSAATSTCYALAYARSEGPAHARRYEADIASMPHRKAAEDAEIVFRHAERTARALEKELVAWQSINSNIRSIWGAAGVGQR